MPFNVDLNVGFAVSIPDRCHGVALGNTIAQEERGRNNYATGGRLRGPVAEDGFDSSFKHNTTQFKTFLDSTAYHDVSQLEVEHSDR